MRMSHRMRFFCPRPSTLANGLRAGHPRSIVWTPQAGRCPTMGTGPFLTGLQDRARAEREMCLATPRRHARTQQRVESG